MTHGEIVLPVAADHPAFPGHFPGMPIVPGVVLLDEALHAIGAMTGTDFSACRISSVKFLSPAAPGEEVKLRYEILANGSIRFEIFSNERALASGSVKPGVAERSS